MHSQKSFLKYFVLVVIFLIGCGEDPYKKGLELFNNEDYDAAIKLFSTVETKDVVDSLFNEIYALAYMYKGQRLYKKTKNVKSFSGNYEKAQKIMPQNPSEDFNSKHSEVLFSLSNAYLKAKGGNSIERDKYYSDAINLLLTSIALDSTIEVKSRLIASE